MSINRHEWLKAVNKDSKLPHRAVRVALALWTRGNETDDHVYPGMDDIMEQSGLSRDTAKRGLLDLVGAGWLHRTEGRGRTNYTVYTFCSPGKVIAISSGKRGANMPQEKGGSSALSGQKKGAALQEKGCSSALSYNKAKQSYEQKGARLDQFKDHLFFGNATAGLMLVPIADHDRLNAWAEWLAGENFPPLHALGIKAASENGRHEYFRLPYRKPPTDPRQLDEARAFFKAMAKGEIAA